MTTENGEITFTGSKVLPFPLREMRVARRRLHKLFCIPCAVKNDEFKERAPASSQTPLDAGGGPRAWIGGRSYGLVHHPAAKVVCIRCGKEVQVAYIPEDELIA